MNEIKECKEIRDLKTLDRVLGEIKGYLDKGLLTEIKDKKRFKEYFLDHTYFDEIYKSGLLPDIISLFFEAPNHDVYILGCNCRDGSGGGFSKLT